MRDGGYESGYSSVPCFWGTDPGSLVSLLAESTDVRGRSVLDLGAGEGKNAHYLESLGAIVEAWEISELAQANAAVVRPQSTVRWLSRDAVLIRESIGVFDVVIAYGLMHCLQRSEIPELIENMKRCTAPGGFNILVAFNARFQDLELAHPGFNPTLLPHDVYLAGYSDWEILVASDTDLVEAHPNNLIKHTHSMTRLLARRPTDG